METIIASVVTGVFAVVICLINNHVQAEKSRALSNAQAKETRELLEYRLKQLEEKQDRHNQVIERTYHIETEVGVIQEQIKVANHRLENLEQNKEDK